MLVSSVWWDRRDLMRSKRRVNKTKARWACLGRSPWVVARRRFPMTRATGVRLPGGVAGSPMVRDIGSWSCHGGFSLESVSLSGCLGRGGEDMAQSPVATRDATEPVAASRAPLTSRLDRLWSDVSRGSAVPGPAVWGSRREGHRPRSVKRSWWSVSESSGCRIALAVSSSGDTRLDLLRNG